eukprot:SAG31_NODE_26807_length_436_cov_0.765579_1_plen_63_part_10
MVRSSSVWWRHPTALLLLGVVGAVADAPFKFERPVLIGESPAASVTGAQHSHFWFPEEGGVVG